MDPDANLKAQRDLVKSLREGAEYGQPFDEVDVDRLLELVQALDEWVSRGGFLPKAWARS